MVFSYGENQIMISNEKQTIRRTRGKKIRKRSNISPAPHPYAGIDSVALVYDYYYHCCLLYVCFSSFFRDYSSSHSSSLGPAWRVGGLSK